MAERPYDSRYSARSPATQPSRPRDNYWDGYDYADDYPPRSDADNRGRRTAAPDSAGGNRPVVVMSPTSGPARPRSPPRGGYRPSDGYGPPGPSSATPPGHRSSYSTDTGRGRDGPGAVIAPARGAAMSRYDNDTYRSTRPSVYYDSPSSSRQPDGGDAEYNDDDWGYTNPGNMARYDLEHTRPSRPDRRPNYYNRPSVVYHDRDKPSLSVETNLDRHYASPSPGGRYDPPRGPAYPARGPHRSAARHDSAPPVAPVPPSPAIVSTPALIADDPPTPIHLRRGPPVSGGRPRPVSLYQDDHYRSRDDDRNRREQRDRDREHEPRRAHESGYASDDRAVRNRRDERGDAGRDRRPDATVAATTGRELVRVRKMDDDDDYDFRDPKGRYDEEYGLRGKHDDDRRDNKRRPPPREPEEGRDGRGARRGDEERDIKGGRRDEDRDVKANRRDEDRDVKANRRDEDRDVKGGRKDEDRDFGKGTRPDDDRAVKGSRRDDDRDFGKGPRRDDRDRDRDHKTNRREDDDGDFRGGRRDDDRDLKGSWRDDGQQQLKANRRDNDRDSRRDDDWDARRYDSDREPKAGRRDGHRDGDRDGDRGRDEHRPRDPRDFRDSRDSRDPRDARGYRDPRDVRNDRNDLEDRERDARDPRGARDRDPWDDRAPRGGRSESLCDEYRGSPKASGKDREPDRRDGYERGGKDNDGEREKGKGKEKEKGQDREKERGRENERGNEKERGNDKDRETETDDEDDWGKGNNKDRGKGGKDKAKGKEKEWDSADEKEMGKGGKGGKDRGGDRDRDRDRENDRDKEKGKYKEKDNKDNDKGKPRFQDRMATALGLGGMAASAGAFLKDKKDKDGKGRKDGQDEDDYEKDGRNKDKDGRKDAEKEDRPTKKKSSPNLRGSPEFGKDADDRWARDRYEKGRFDDDDDDDHHRPRGRDPRDRHTRDAEYWDGNKAIPVPSGDSTDSSVREPTPDSDEPRHRIRARVGGSRDRAFDPINALDLRSLREEMADLDSGRSRDGLRPGTRKSSADLVLLAAGDRGSGDHAALVPVAAVTTTTIVTTEKPNPDARPIKGILKAPSSKFPEEPNPIREGVALHKDDKKLKEVPPGARWTKISRKMVNPEALMLNKERFEERDDFVIVLRVLSKEEIQDYVNATKVLRERRRAREIEYHAGHEDDDRRKGASRQGDDRERDVARGKGRDRDHRKYRDDGYDTDDNRRRRDGDDRHYRNYRD